MTLSRLRDTFLTLIQNYKKPSDDVQRSGGRLLDRQRRSGTRLDTQPPERCGSPGRHIRKALSMRQSTHSINLGQDNSASLAALDARADDFLRTLMQYSYLHSFPSTEFLRAFSLLWEAERGREAYKWN